MYISIYIQSYIHPSLYTCILICICTHLYICTSIQTPQTLPQNDLILKQCIRFFITSASPPPHRLVQFWFSGHNHFVCRLKTSFYTASKQNPVERIFSPLKDFCSVWQVNSKSESKENFNVWDDRISLCGRHFLSTHNWNFVSTQIFCFFSTRILFQDHSLSLAACLCHCWPVFLTPPSRLRVSLSVRNIALVSVYHTAVVYSCITVLCTHVFCCYAVNITYTLYLTYV